MKDPGVQSVTRALALLRRLARASEGLGVSELARDCDLAVSTTHRLLTTLQAEDFALFDPSTRLWHVGREAFATGLAFGRRSALAGRSLPHLRRLRDLTRETANVGIPRDGRMITVGQVESREIMRAIASPGGDGVPLSASGMGKAVLSTWPEEAVRDHVATHGLPPLTAHSHRTIDSLLEDLRVCRARGWALDDQEHAPGLRCIAAVIDGPGGDPEGAVSVSGLAMRLTDARLDAVSRAVMETAAALKSAGG